MPNNSSIATGSKSGLYWKQEATLGLAATGNFNSVFFSSEGFGDTINRIQSGDMRSDRRNSSLRGGNKMSNGSISQDLGIVRCLPWLRHLLAAGNAAAGSAVTPATIAASTLYTRGDYVKNATDTYVCIQGGTTDVGVSGASLTALNNSRQTVPGATSTELVFEHVGLTSGTSLYQHTLTAGVDFPSVGLTFEKQIKGGDTSLFNQFVGCRFASLDLQIPQEGMITANWSVMALDSVVNNASGIGTVVSPVDPLAVGYDAYVHLNGDATASANRAISSLSLSINNGLSDVYVLGQRNRDSIPEGTRLCSGSLSTFFKDLTEYNYFLNEQEISIVLSIITKGMLLKFEFPEVKLTGPGTPTVGGPGVVSANFEWTAFYENGSGNYDCRVTAVNTTQNLAA